MTTQTSSKVIPQKSRNHKILAERNGRLKWFTAEGWELLSDTVFHDEHGNQVTMNKQGFRQVDPNMLNPAPPPIEKRTPDEKPSKSTLKKVK